MRAAALFVALASVGACHSGDAETAPVSSDSAQGTKIVYTTPPTTSPAQHCRVRVAGDGFAAARDELGARLVASVHVDGDYTRALAKVAVEPAGNDAGPSVGAWSGSFNGPRDAFLDMLQRRICTDESRLHALLPRGAKDPSKGEVVLDVYAVPPDEHGDVDRLCHAYERAPKPASPASPDASDAAAMRWAEDVLTTAQWEGFFRDLARARGSLLADKADAGSLFHARGAALEAAAKADKLACPTAADWNKR